MKRILAIAITATLVVFMFCFNISAANKTIEVDPGADLGGDIWTVVTCEHPSPEDIKNDGTYGIGWTKNGDIIKLTEPIDFGDGLVSLKVMMASVADPDANSKLVFKAGNTVFAEVMTINTGDWLTYQETSAVLKDAVKGKQEVTIEWVLPDGDNGSAPGRNLGLMKFEVNGASSAATSAAATTSVASSSASPSAASSSASATKAATASATAKASATSSKPAASNSDSGTKDKSSNVGLYVGIAAGVIVVGAIVAFIVIKNKK